MTVFLACALTVAIEAPFLALFGYRDRNAQTIIICANVVTNLLLNLSLSLFPLPGWAMYPMEALVVAAEYLVYARAFGRSLKLFLLTLAANCLSYGVGLLIFFGLLIL